MTDVSELFHWTVRTRVKREVLFTEKYCQTHNVYFVDRFGVRVPFIH